MDFEQLWAMANELGDVLPILELTEPERRDLVAHMRARRLRTGEVLYHRGDPGADIFVVHRGLVKSVLHDGNGREVIIGLHARGDFFGTLMLFEDSTRESSSVAVMGTTLLQIARADALRTLERNPRAMYFMFERLAVAIHRLTGMIEGIVFLDVPGRLARYLVELGQAERLLLSQDEIAAALGASREAVNKALTDFERRGLVRVTHRQIQILQTEQLRREIRA